MVASVPLGGSLRRAATRMGLRGQLLGKLRAPNSAGGGLYDRRRAVQLRLSGVSHPVGREEPLVASATNGLLHARRPRRFGSANVHPTDARANGRRSRHVAPTRATELVDQLLPGGGLAVRKHGATAVVSMSGLGEAVAGSTIASSSQRWRRRREARREAGQPTPSSCAGEGDVASGDPVAPWQQPRRVSRRRDSARAAAVAALRRLRSRRVSTPDPPQGPRRRTPRRWTTWCQ